MIGFYASLFAASFAVTAVLVPIIMRLARRCGFLDQPGPRKIHTVPIPYGGGIAVAAGVLGTAVGGNLGGTLPKSLIIYALGALAILALGLVDDRRRLSARFKLFVQTIIATGVALGGERFELFDAAPALSVAVTVLWILGVTNAFNLLDHMDGLSGGVALLSGAAFLVVAIQTGQTFIGSLLVPLLGACAAFLLFNFPPARIFLGDAGSLFIGFWISCLTISFTFYDRAHFRLYTYFVPPAVLAVPLFDTAGVIVIRLLRGRPIFEGDTNHLAHRLTRLGMSRRLAVLTIYALSLFAGVSAILLYHVGTTGAILVLVQLLLTFGIITILEAAGRAHADGP